MTTRADALADAVEAYLAAWDAPIEESEDGGVDHGFACAVARNNLRSWIHAYRSAAPAGEVVRLAVRRCWYGQAWAEPEHPKANPLGVRDLGGEWSEVLCVVTATLPPRQEPPVVEGECHAD